MKLFDYINDRKRIPFNSVNVANLAKNHGPFLDQLDSMKSLPVHSGCVNTIEWNKTGEYILSGSDDKCLCITRPTCLFDRSKNYTVLQKITTTHLGNIFSAKFLPNTADTLIASCSSNGPVIVTDVNSQNPSQGIFVFNCHTQSIFDVVPIHDDDRVFLTCSEDQTVRLFDLRCHRSCTRSSTCPHPALIRNSHAITKLSLHPLNSNMLLLGRADGKGLVYDRRKLPNPANFSRQQAHAERMADPIGASQKTFQFLHPLDGVVSKFCVPGINDCRFTSLCFSPLGNQVLASYTKDDVYLFNYDKSSRIELDQTLIGPSSEPSGSSSEDNSKKPNYEQIYQDALDGLSSDTSHRLMADTNQNHQELARRNHMIRNRERRMGRPHRIIWHGDWSDTGVDSTPATNRSGSRVTMESLTNQAFRLFVQQGSQQAFASYFGFPPTERNSSASESGRSRGRNIIETNSENSSRSNNNSNNNRSTLNRGRRLNIDNPNDPDSELYLSNDDNEDDDDDQEEPDLLDANFVVIDSSDNDDDDEEDEDDNGEDDDDTEEDVYVDLSEPDYSRIDPRIRNDKKISSDVSGSRGQHRAANHEAEDISTSSLKRKARETPPPSTNNHQQSSELQQANSKEGIRAETRLKFRRATEVLKSRYKNIHTYHPKNSYFGHRNRRTIIKQADFWGDDYIMSGSDCGRIFFWEKESGKIVSVFKGDGFVVNRLAAHPHYYALASSGIDYDIKLWSTQSSVPTPLKPNQEEISKIVENNENMLDENMSTVTVPPQLFFRFLATLTHSQNLD